MIKRIALWLSIGFAIFLLQVSVLAAEPIGVVIAAQGHVWAEDGAGNTRELKRRDNVFIDEWIITGANSNAVLHMHDDSIASLQASSRYSIQELNYSKNNPKTSRNVAALTQGALLFISGQSEHGDYKVKTPVATIGIRGSVDLINVNSEKVVGRMTKTPSKTAEYAKSATPASASKVPASVQLTVIEGSATITPPIAQATTSQTTQVNAGSGASVTTGAGGSPKVTPTPPQPVSQIVDSSPGVVSAVTNTVNSLNSAGALPPGAATTSGTNSNAQAAVNGVSAANSQKTASSAAST